MVFRQDSELAEDITAEQDTFLLGRRAGGLDAVLKRFVQRPVPEAALPADEKVV